MFYEPGKGHGLPHDPFKAIVAPRPIGWISTRSTAGEINLAPYSFFNALASNPHLVFFSSEGTKYGGAFSVEGAKDSATFARESGEFVANLVGRELAERMNATSVDAPRGVSEFGYAGLTPAPSRIVAAPRVAEAPAALECRVTEILEPRALDGSRTAATVVIGQVVGIHIADEILVDGLFDVRKAGNVARLGYFDFSSTEDVFVMRRPKWKGDGKA